MISEKRLRQQTRRVVAARDQFTQTLDNITGLMTMPVGTRDLTLLAKATAELKHRRIALRSEMWSLRRLLPASLRRAAMPKRRVPRGPDEEMAAAAATLEPLRLMLRQLGATIAILEQLCDAPRTPLYVDIDRADPRTAQARVIDQAYDVLHINSRSEQQDAAAISAGAHADIPLAASLFLAHVHFAWRVLAAQGRSETARFIDVGSGAGSKVVLASRVFAQADGLELDPGYAEASRRMLGQRFTTNCRTIEGDALEFDGFDGYDVIYFFLPIRDRDAMRALEDRIIARARPRTVLITPYAGFTDRAEQKGVAKLAGSVSITQTTSAEAATLIDGARLIGPLMPGPEGLKLRSSDGLLAPLIHALRLNGYAD
ncbi:MAG: class I SAM-dependent methyltransferase [Pseudomonadota bacterium]